VLARTKLPRHGILGINCFPEPLGFCRRPPFVSSQSFGHTYFGKRKDNHRMPVKVNVGLTKKLGLPNYGSAGASCNLEFELDTGQILDNPDGFQRHVHNAYEACRKAVLTELSHQLQSDSLRPAEMREADRPSNGPAESSDSGSVTTPATLGIVHASPLASQRQINYVHHLAHGIPRLTPRRLEILCATVCGKRLAHLTATDASQLIDTLKDIQAGDKDLSGIPQEVSA
jgi:hypothetical protein